MTNNKFTFISHKQAIFYLTYSSIISSKYVLLPLLFNTIICCFNFYLIYSSTASSTNLLFFSNARKYFRASSALDTLCIILISKDAFAGSRDCTISCNLRRPANKYYNFIIEYKPVIFLICFIYYSIGHN